MWLYVDVLKPQTRHHEIIQPAPPVQNREADSLAKLYASMPRDLKIYFDFDKTKMLPPQDVESSISALKDWIMKYPSTILVVTGHTDFIGKPDYNKKLATERAVIVNRNSRLRQRSCKPAYGSGKSRTQKNRSNY